jgi:small subunit ribosomal protein S2
MSKIPTIEQMLKAGMHFGHRTSKWHPKAAPFIFTKRHGVHIIDLVKSRVLLVEAIEFMQKLAQEGKVILFVGTKMQAKKSIKSLAEETGMPYVTEKWMGGCLTNFLVIKKMIKKYNDYIRDKNSGKLDKYTKKERLELEKEMNKLELKVGGLTNLNKTPDALFIWDIINEKTAVLEAKKKNVPIIAICDTNTNPSGINYPIPSNDDATKTIKLLTNTIKENILEAKANKNKIETPSK